MKFQIERYKGLILKKIKKVGASAAEKNNRNGKNVVMAYGGVSCIVTQDFLTKTRVVKIPQDSTNRA